MKKLKYLFLIIMVTFFTSAPFAKAETVDFPPKFIDYTLDQEWQIPAGGSLTGQINFLSSQPLDTSFAFVDVCTTGYEPTLWITSMAFGEIAASTNWYKLDIPCNTGGRKADVYRQIMYIPSSVSVTDSTYGSLYNVAATGRLFSNTKEYLTYMRLLHIGLSENIPLDDIILQNDMTQTELLRDILDSLSNNDSTMQGVLESNQAIKEQTEKLKEETEKLNENITNDKVDSGTGSDFFDSFATNDNGGISAIVTAPLSAIEKMVSGTCTPIKGSYKGKEFSFPCGDTFWADMQDVKQFLNIVLGGFLCYGILAKLYLLIDRLKDPEDDRVDVMKL